MPKSLRPTALLALAGLSVGAFAAQHDECGTVLSPELAARALRLHAAGAYDPPPMPEGSGPLLVHLAFHVVRQSNGEGGLPERRLDIALDDANTAFATTGIQFCAPYPIDYIDDDSFYFDVDTVEEINALRMINVVPDAINCYFTEELLFCGVSSFSTSSVQGIVMNNQCTATPTNHSTFPHEIGHYFDLDHTHSTTFGAECVDGTNCSTAGDMICDTPADPRLNAETVTEECVYVGDETDGCNGDPYSPQTWNFMSYSRKHCRIAFTAEQEAKMLATLVNLRPEHIQRSCGCGVTTDCESTVNSSGGAAVLSTTGTTSVAANDLVLHASSCPDNQFGIFYYGQRATQQVFGDGFRCIDGQVFRLDVLNTGASGSALHALDLLDPPEPAGQITAGSTWRFQFWFRDPAAGASGFNLSDSIEAQFCP